MISKQTIQNMKAAYTMAAALTEAEVIIQNYGPVEIRIRLEAHAASLKMYRCSATAVEEQFGILDTLADLLAPHITPVWTLETGQSKS